MWLVILYGGIVVEKIVEKIVEVGAVDLGMVLWKDSSFDVLQVLRRYSYCMIDDLGYMYGVCNKDLKYSIVYLILLYLFYMIYMFVFNSSTRTCVSHHLSRSYPNSVIEALVLI